MSRTSIRTLILAIGACAILWCAIVATAVSVASAAPSAHCQEDSPCWTWPTMGNHKRGIVTLWGTPKVVGPCGFRHYMLGHTAREQRLMGYGMRGDWYVMHVVGWCAR